MCLKVRLLFLLLFIFFISDLGAQTNAGGGLVLDGKTGKPVAGASVYISSSSYGTSCNGEGRFLLAVFPAPPFRLTISAVGYSTTTVEVAKIPEAEIIIKLEPRALELEAVVVRKPEKDGWEKFGKQFTEDFIGYSDYARDCKILNHKVLNFYYDRAANELVVTAREPLLIRNNALGYTITYWLEDFRKTYSSGALYFQGSSQFTDLITPGTRKGKAEKWTEHRQTAFNGSLQHFIRTLWKGNTAAEGFEVRSLQRVPLADYYEQFPKRRDTLVLDEAGTDSLRRILLVTGKTLTGTGTMAQHDSTVKDIIRSVKNWYNDTTDDSRLQLALYDDLNGKQGKVYVDFKKSEGNKGRLLLARYRANPLVESQVKKGIVTVVNPNLLNTDSLVKVVDSSTRAFAFTHFLHITYTREWEEEIFHRYSDPFARPYDSRQITIVSLQEVPYVLIYPNGHFDPSYALFLERYWSFEKLDKLLPLDYAEK